MTKFRNKMIFYYVSYWISVPDDPQLQAYLLVLIRKEVSRSVVQHFCCKTPQKFHKNEERSQ